MNSKIDWEWIVLMIVVGVVVIALSTGGEDHHTLTCANGVKVERSSGWEPSAREVAAICDPRPTAENPVEVGP